MKDFQKRGFARNIAWAYLIACLSLMSPISNAGQSATTTSSTQTVREKVEAAKLIDQLDDPDPELRLSATLRLNGLDAGALDVAEAVAKRDDLSPETRTRLQRALTFIRSRAAAQRRRIAVETWRRKLFHNAYDQGAHTNPKYDADAHAAIDQYLAIRVEPLNSPTAIREHVLATFEKAEAAGCNDPMIRALHRLANGLSRGLSTRPRQGDEAVLYNCCQANYPSAVKFHIWATFVTARVFVDTADVQLLAGWMAQSLADPEFPPVEVDERLDPIDRTSSGSLDAPGWKQLFDRYAALAPRAPGPLLFRARSTRNAARNFRADQIGRNQFDDKAVAQFSRQIADAIQLADQAYQLDPTDGRAAEFVLDLQSSVLSDIRQSDPTMELWFERAIAADPDNLRPYELKMSYLQELDDGLPKVLEFGRECLQSQNWRGGIPLIVVAAHDCISDHSGDRTAYFLRPDVWEDIRQAYEGGLINFPEDLQRRCEYAKLAAQCGHWDIADRQFQRIGDHAVFSVFGGESSFKYFRAKARRLAATQPSEH